VGQRGAGLPISVDPPTVPSGSVSGLYRVCIGACIGVYIGAVIAVPSGLYIGVCVGVCIGSI
jgi:hypothetical protein